MATEEELTDQDIEFIKELRQAREKGIVNRRQALGLLAGVGIGGAAGYAGVERASASNHNDSDGDVGTDSDRVDVWADMIKTDNLDITNIPTDGTQKQVLKAAGANNDGVWVLFQREDSVGTSATKILEAPGGDMRSWSVEVFGYDASSMSTAFWDRIHGTTFTNSALTVINSETSNTPAGRTYSKDGTDIALAMGSDTYNVGAVARYTNIERN